MTTTNYDPRILKAPHPVPGAPDNWKRFFSFNTDAKVIGIQYIATSLFFLLVGGLLANRARRTDHTAGGSGGSECLQRPLHHAWNSDAVPVPVPDPQRLQQPPQMIGAPDMAAECGRLLVGAAVRGGVDGEFLRPRGAGVIGVVVVKPAEPPEPLHQRPVPLDSCGGSFGDLLDHGRRQFRDDDHPDHGLLQDADLRVQTIQPVVR